MSTIDKYLSKKHTLQEMKVYLGEEGLKHSWQKEFPPKTDCCKCDGESRIAFVCFENNEEKYVSQIHDNEGADGGPYWPHDAVAVAIYFCEKCLEPTALYNQA